MSKILGLDLGTNSIGWAYIDELNNKILGTGVRIFPMGVENLGQGDKEMSKNASRTSARGTRRQFFRRSMRKKLLLKALAEQKMCPLNPSDIKVWNFKEFEKDEIFSSWIRQNPYELRHKAISEKVTLLELGRIFYHLIQRRGFQSNSRSASKDAGKIFEGIPKDGKIGILETAEKIQNTTLGSYLNSLYPAESQSYTHIDERIRNRYTSRNMYETEFEEIWNNQVKYHSELTSKLKTIIGGRKKDGYSEDGILFFQRPLRSQKFLVGKCAFEPKKTKCPKSAIPFEYFRIYQWVNTVECNGSKLNAEDRNKLVKILLKKENPAFKELRKELKLTDSIYQFNYKDDDKISGSHTIRSLSSKKFFGEEWFDFSEKYQEEIWHDLIFYKDKDKLKQRAIEKWGFNEEKATAISKFNLVDGYANLSRKAINNILPFLKMGFTYNIAVALGGIKNAFGDSWETLDSEDKTLITDNIFDVLKTEKEGGYIQRLRNFLVQEFNLTETQLEKLYHHSANISAKELLDKLPVGKDADAEIRSIRNPIVIQALFELRKVSNDLIDRFGKPDKIHIELARDLKASKKKRHKIKQEQDRLKKENDRVKKELERLGRHISNDNILKYKLWEECNNICPYTGRKISVVQLFSGEVQIEHIMPWSRSLNDSFMNKTLCFADENRAKGNRTPYEFYFKEQGEAKWEQVKEQALTCFKTKINYPNAYAKFKQFIKKELDDDFVTRQLNDTRFISREAKAYLSKICDKIIVAPGQMTSNLRHKWGLNSILNDDDNKTRDDHRHHAVDALVMACSKVSYLQELSRWNRYERSYDLENFPMPWDSFRKDAEKSILSILVSHRKSNRVLNSRKYKVKKKGEVYVNTGVAARGQLHKEYVYGKRQSPNSEQGFHKRSPIESLKTEKQVNKVVDPFIRDLIHARVATLGGYVNGNIPEGTFFTSDENGNKIPMIYLPNKNGDKVPVKKIRIREVIGGAERLKEENQYVNPRNNHHVLIYEDMQGNLKEDVVTFWTVVERVKQKQPLFQLPFDGKRIIETLEINDMFLLGLHREEIDWENPDYTKLSNHLFRVQKFTSGDYYFRKHIESSLDGELGHAFQYIKGFGTGKTGWLTFNPIKIKLTESGKLSEISN